MADGAKKSWDSNLTDEEKQQMRNLSRRVIEVMLRRTREEVPEKGSFMRISVSFDVVRSKNRAFMAVEEDELDKQNTRRVCLVVTRPGCGYMMSEYHFKGSKAEVLEFLQTEGLEEKLYDRFGEMSERWDEKMDEYPFG